jgi:hypothetical protein
MAKKILTLVAVGVLVILSIMLATYASAKYTNYNLDSPSIIDSNSLGDYGYIYDNEYYYQIPAGTYAVKLGDGISKGKLFICNRELSVNETVVIKRSVLLKKNKVYEITITSDEVIKLSSDVIIYFQLQEKGN